MAAAGRNTGRFGQAMSADAANVKEWIKARKLRHLSHAHVQMARELGMNPKKLGAVDNHQQEPWKAPLPEFIERLYEKRFGRERPAVVVTVEEWAAAAVKKKAAKRAAKAERKAQQNAVGEVDGVPSTEERSLMQRLPVGPERQ